MLTVLFVLFVLTASAADKRASASREYWQMTSSPTSGSTNSQIALVSLQFGRFPNKQKDNQDHEQMHTPPSIDLLAGGCTRAKMIPDVVKILPCGQSKWDCIHAIITQILEYLFTREILGKNTQH